MSGMDILSVAQKAGPYTITGMPKQAEETKKGAGFFKSRNPAPTSAGNALKLTPKQISVLKLARQKKPGVSDQVLIGMLQQSGLWEE